MGVLFLEKMALAYSELHACIAFTVQCKKYTCIGDGSWPYALDWSKHGHCQLSKLLTRKTNNMDVL